MSIDIMSMVFKRYPAGGGELLLALALADHAHDDGTRIYPRVADLAHKTRQAVRTVQYQLKSMQRAGWLIKCGNGDGGRGRAVVYRISPQWLKGADIAPFSSPQDDDDERGVPDGCDDGDGAEIEPPEAISGSMGGGSVGACEHADRDANDAPKGAIACTLSGLKGAPVVAPFRPPEKTQKGATAIAPAIEPSVLIHTPLPPCQGDHGSDVDGGSSTGRQKRSRGQSMPIGLKAFIESCKQRGEKVIPEGSPVFAYADSVGIPRDVLALHWQEFRERHLEADRRQRDWRRAFLNSVKGNWYRLWYLLPDGGCQLSTTGLQAKAWHAGRGDGPVQAAA